MNVHVHIECDGCGDCPIKGTRWKCSDCDDFDLCNPCYIIKKHVIRHSFLQIDVPNSRSANCGMNKPFDLFSMAHIRGLHRKLKIDEGVVHPQIQCDACSDCPIKGIRWKCSDCDDFDLCDPCYTIYKHAKSHSFLRIDATISRPHHMGKINVHLHIECDGCGDCPIKGTRWKCSDCDDFDMCDHCYIITKHTIRHSFLQIDVPNSRSVATTRKCIGTPPEWEIMGRSESEYHGTLQVATAKKGIGTPSEWEIMGRSETVKRVPLLPYLGEHEMVANIFRTTLRHAEILQIDRIQNVFLWECYQLKRIQLERKYGFTNERELFHGTLPNNVDVICKDNFDFRLAGERVGTRLGQGTYFARDAKYSDSYASPDKQGGKCMFLAKVLCGKWCNGDGNYKRPPPVDPKRKHSDLYDCCVDDVDDPKIVCVFDQNQYYPHYLIKYR